MFSTLKGFGTRMKDVRELLKIGNCLYDLSTLNHLQLMLLLSKHLFCSDRCYHTYQKYETQN